MLYNFIERTKSNYKKKVLEGLLDNSNHTELNEINVKGKVISVKDGIVRGSGLRELKAGEMVLFPQSCVKGMCLNLEKDNVGIVVFEEEMEIRVGDEIVGTNKLMSLDISDTMIGKVINGVGKIMSHIDGAVYIDKETSEDEINEILIERKAPGIITRKSVHEPLQTGIKAIDSLLPIGRGQRELIIGDRQTGKTTIAVDTIINQRSVNEEIIDMYCIYVAIGQKLSSIQNVCDGLVECKEYLTIVSASASDNAALQFLSPYTGCAVGEYYRDNGSSSLIIYDDLSKHAIAYRQMSLLLRRPPGREAYPGDIFYIHSRLLERASKLNELFGGGSLTALPIVETQAGDISGYIPTNIISITDGQIFLEKELFYKGIRPAVNVGQSVSRVGSAAQVVPMKRISGSLKLELALFREVQIFSQFDADIDESTKNLLRKGELLTEILKQTQNEPLSLHKQLLILYGGLYGSLKDMDLTAIKEYERKLYAFVDREEFIILKPYFASLEDNKEFTVEENIFPMIYEMLE